MQNNLLRTARDLVEKRGGKLIFLAYAGSKLHGTDTPDSDTDVKGVYIPGIEEIILGKEEVLVKATSPDVSNGSEDIDIEIFPLRRFTFLLTRGEIGPLDMLFSSRVKDMVLHTSPEFEEIYNNRDLFLTSNVDSFIGFAFQQLERYHEAGKRYNNIKEVADILIPAPGKTVEDAILAANGKVDDLIVIRDKGGIKEQKFLSLAGRMFDFKLRKVDFDKAVKKILSKYGSRVKEAAEEGDSLKAMSHAVRSLLEAEEFLLTKKLVFPLKDKDLLRDIKTGKLQKEHVSEMIKEGMKKVKELRKQSNIQEEVDFDKINEFIVNMTKKSILST